MRRVRIPGSLQVNWRKSVRVTPRSLAALLTSPNCLLNARAAASSLKCASDAGRRENIGINDQSGSDNSGFDLGHGRFGETNSAHRKDR